jgi:hypothetical protein
MLLNEFPFSFSALVMLLMFAILIGGTSVAIWRMVIDPTEEPKLKILMVEKTAPSPFGRPVQPRA